MPTLVCRQNTKGYQGSSAYGILKAQVSYIIKTKNAECRIFTERASKTSEVPAEKLYIFLAKRLYLFCVVINLVHNIGKKSSFYDFVWVTRFWLWSLLYIINFANYFLYFHFLFTAYHKIILDKAQQKRQQDTITQDFTSLYILFQATCIIFDT